MQNLAVKKQHQRWITEINNGVVQLVQRIESDALVVSVKDLPDICANAEIVCNEQALLIEQAIKTR